MALRFTVIGDGSTDRALVPIVTWVLMRVPRVAEAGFAVEFTLGRQGGSDLGALAGKIGNALVEFPCDLLFVHRDAEAEPAEHRLEEIDGAARKAGAEGVVPIVPIRMTEAWLLFDEQAIRRAADNPNGRVPIQLPGISRLESLPDPKRACNDLLVRAAEKSGRRLEKFRRDSELAWRRVRLAELIGDFQPLLKVSAFSAFHDASIEACETLGID